jgi:hypothetical protein
MKNFREIVFQTLGLTFAVFVVAFTATAQQIRRTPFDVIGYKMDVSLIPGENRLNATVDVNFVPLEDTRTVSFELNGSLKIDSIVRQNQTAAPVSTVRNPRTAPVAASQNQVTFVQDQVGVSDLGPSVKIDLGENVTKERL